MYDDIATMARYVTPRGGPRTGTVADLAHPVVVVGAAMPVGELEVLFRAPEVRCVAVQEEDGPRTGVVSRAGLATALTGRLGYGRAVLERKPTGSVTHWSPLVVRPGTPVAEVATLAMARGDQHRYEDVLVAGSSWASASTSDVMRSLVASLAERTTHDPATRLATRGATWQALAHRCSMVGASGTRVVLVLLDVQGMAHVNAAHGERTGDAVLAEVAARLTAALPRGCEAGRVDGDRFAVLATLPAMDDVQAAASAESLRRHLVAGAQGAVRCAPGLVVALHSSVVWSVAAGASAEDLIHEGERRLVLGARPAGLAAS
ncbi:diguanylate cyclase (GGDEF)-like protein [Sediminihabitans luteus]|uniref:Diguanylate cyclase (GGDEF)-like protein n=1 Tax=Sediminihabitans luteus TaxID=1138585 RepID=A0A2M9CCU2_9CELL|nr:GGDEF domain-containing protein [Sediminihabitans luteus]PJJ69205.1 diguanylate cyclase (GGDEF)-like protein [Sediminihabitans luteus]GII98880.1 hypothetical protein Slu03_12580 [Sediminihabitans luteus]